MASTATKQRIGEAGVRDYINKWFPYAHLGVHGAQRAPSKGMNDEGDIDMVPYTCIEVKNHANPVVGSLLYNAQWKAANAKRPLWFLCYKRAGYSPNRAGEWNVLMTVQGFLDGIKPVLPGLEIPPFTVDQVPDLVAAEEDMMLDVSANYPMVQAPVDNRWGIHLKFRPWMNNMSFHRDYCWDVGMDYDNLRTPFIINPRVSSDPANWFVYTRLESMCRVMETIGILPQDKEDYEYRTQQNEEN